MVPQTDRSTSVLVVEDDENILNLLCAYLESAGHRVATASDGPSGLALMLEGRFDICVLDVMLPGETGMEVAEAVRAAGNKTPILFLTALGSEADILRGFNAGADDYVVKPFSPRELVMRLDAILRRSAASLLPDAPPAHMPAPALASASAAATGLEMSPEDPTCRVDGQEVALTHHEHCILRKLVARPNRVFDRSSLIASIYGSDFAISPKAIDVHIHNLRGKLGPQAGALIQTVRGFGYRFVPEAAPQRMARA
ncbi:MAG: response regulator transcription factor [Rhodospirillaceae bacterium]